MENGFPGLFLRKKLVRTVQTVKISEVNPNLDCGGEHGRVEALEVERGRFMRRQIAFVTEDAAPCGLWQYLGKIPLNPRECGE
jgi:hypothetical protein